MTVLVTVVGHHRGGTSATAGTLQALGVHFGSEFLKPTAENPNGYFENIHIVSLHDHLLRAMGRTWHDGTTLPTKHPEIRWVRHQITKEIAYLRGPGHPIIGVKDPRIAQFLSLWLTVTERENIALAPIVVRRDDDAVMASLRAHRTELGTEEQRRRLVRNHNDMLDLWAKHENAQQVHYPETLNWRSGLWPALWEIMTKLAPGVPAPNERQVEAADTFVEPALCHHG